jgi:hypothetical protein
MRKVTPPSPASQRRAAAFKVAENARKARLAAMTRANRIFLEIYLNSIRQKTRSPKNKIARKSK